MILYLDTSALVKAYVTEEHSQTVLSLMHHADVIACHRIAFIETHAAFFRLQRENKLSAQDIQKTLAVFREDWLNYLQIENSQALMEIAVDFAEAFALRAYDSVHLAAGMLLLKQSKQTVTFACFDQHLNKAAKILGMELAC